MVDSINNSQMAFDKFKTNSTNNVQTQNYLPKVNTSNPLQRTPQADTVELHNNQGLSKNTKIGIGAAALLGLGALTYVLTRGKVGSSSAKQLAEHIDFKQAETMEEAVKFAKEKLGVKLKLENNLTAANFINEMLVNVSNKMKGKGVLPKKVIINRNLKSADGLEGYASMSYGHKGKERLTIGPELIRELELADKRGESFVDLWKEFATKNSKIDPEWPMRAIYHEIGHANHFATCKDATKMCRLGEMKKHRIKDTHITEEFLKEVKDNKVIQNFMKENGSVYVDELGCYYDLSSPAEAVATIFGLKILGKKIPAEVEKIYTKYGGPAVVA